MSKLLKHISAALLAIASVALIYIFQQDNLLDYYAETKPSKRSIQLQNDLESGRIVMFGSSELGRKHHKFIPENFFNKDLNLPLSAVGSGGHKEFCILTEIAAMDNAQTRDNARIIVVLSAGWFFGSHQGTEIPNFIKYVDTSMLTKLYFESDVEDTYKILVSQYIKEHISDISHPSFIYRYAKSYNTVYNKRYWLEKLFLEKSLAKLKQDRNKTTPIQYTAPTLDYEALRKKAIAVAKPSDNNPYGIINDVFTKKIKPKLAQGKFPYIMASSPIDPYTHREYKDFLALVNLLKNYKHKPLFIFIDSNPLAYVKNRESMFPVLDAIKDTLSKYNYGYLNMWTYDKSKYEIASMVDQSHVGELGWVRINKKIIEHFMPNTGVKQ